MPLTDSEKRGYPLELLLSSTFLQWSKGLSHHQWLLSQRTFQDWWKSDIQDPSSCTREWCKAVCSCHSSRNRWGWKFLHQSFWYSFCGRIWQEAKQSGTGNFILFQFQISTKARISQVKQSVVSRLDGFHASMCPIDNLSTCRVFRLYIVSRSFRLQNWEQKF